MIAPSVTITAPHVFPDRTKPGISRGESSPAGRTRIRPLLGLAAVGGIVGYLLVPSHEAMRGVAAAEATATLDGKPLPLDGEEVKTLDAARAIAHAYVGQPLTLSVPGSGSRDKTREELGGRVDPERLASLVAEVRDPTSALRRAHDQVARGRPIRLPLPVATDARRAMTALLQVKDELDRQPVDARLDLEANKVIPDESGRRVDVYATLAKLDDAFVRGEPRIDAVVETVPAARTADNLKDVRIDDVLGYFETRYALDQKHEARSYNLHLAASKLNGTVVFPGETFDLNDTVGPRTEVNGYRVAPVIAQGELVDGVGGGTCQIAGTLHGAAFFAGLDVVERHPHTRPSFYIKMGLDAAVAYPTITLKLRNPYSFPIVLHETVAGGLVRAEVLGPRRGRDVTFVRKINEVTPFAEKEVPDPKIPRGMRSLTQRGIPGFKITRQRIVRDGSLAARERMQDVYPSTTQIWHVGTGDADPKFIPHDDEHPEYVVDEYLMVAQGPDIQSPHARGAEKGGGTLESRVSGKYGTRGWTVRQGFSKALHGGSTSSSRSGGVKEDAPGVD